jgi:hypothetical protein
MSRITRCSGRAAAVRGAFLLLAAALTFVPRAARAAEGDVRNDTRSEATGDYLFPSKGGFAATLGTGLPFLGLGELAYGVSDGFAVGALAAATPDMSSSPGTSAFGVRPRGVVWREGSWRSVLVAPILYYPSIDGFGGGRDPWVLTRPELTIERRFGTGAWANVALGVIAAACTESLLSLGEEHSRTVMGGVWSSARVGGGVRILGRASLFGEASLVMQGVVPARNWIGSIPAVVVLGVAVPL